MPRRPLTHGPSPAADAQDTGHHGVHVGAARVAAGSAADPAASVPDALRALRRELRRLERDAGDGVGLPPAQTQALRALVERPARSLTELAERTHTDPSSVSVVVQRLVEAGLVSRTPAVEDRRRTMLALTAAGRARLRRRPTADHRLADAVARLGGVRAAVLADALSGLTRALREAPRGT